MQKTLLRSLCNLPNNLRSKDYCYYYPRFTKDTLRSIVRWFVHSHTPVSGYAEIQTQVVWLKNLCSFLTNQLYYPMQILTTKVQSRRTLLGHLRDLSHPRMEHWGCKGRGDIPHYGREEQYPCPAGHHGCMTKVMQISSATATGYAFEASMNLSV